MVNIILYGGCHAAVLRDLLMSRFKSNQINIETYVNYELIRFGKPFPIERLKTCDILFFSPIENKGAYNTDALVAACREKGVMAVCYPWMEWHGYCPGAAKGMFKGHYQWYYPKLVEAATSFSRFPDFVEYAISRFPDVDDIDRIFDDSTKRLSSAEQAHSMQIRLSDYIAENYRASRLFLVSDHPALAVYNHALRQMLEIIGLALPAPLTGREPQSAWRTPILPRVATRLRLDFDDRDWLDETLLPDEVASFEAYLQLYFYSDSVILGPRRHDDPSAGLVSAATYLPMRHDSRILATPCAVREPSGAERYEYLDTLAGPVPHLQRHQQFSIEPTLWRQTWEG